MLGLPGAGKTTASQLIAEHFDAVHVSSDELRREIIPTSNFSQTEHDRLYKLLDDRVAHLLHNGLSVVYDANLNRRVHRDEKYRLATELDANPILIWVQAPHELAKKRRVYKEPQHDLTPPHETPEQFFDRVAGIFEAPGRDEPYYAIDGRHITATSINELEHSL